MKYTRYDVKRRKNENVLFAAVFIVILILAFLIASVIANFTLKNTLGDTTPEMNLSKQNSVSDTAGKNSKNQFVIIQGGVFTKKETADDTINILTPYGNPFSITKDNNIKVLLGIYEPADADKVAKTLTDKSIDNFKTAASIKISQPCDEEIADIIDGNIQILTKLGEKDVSVKTDSLKLYCSKLKNPDKSSKNKQVFDDLKKYVSNLPSVMHKDKAAENYIYLYNIITKLAEKTS